MRRFEGGFSSDQGTTPRDAGEDMPVELGKLLMRPRHAVVAQVRCVLCTRQCHRWLLQAPEGAFDVRRTEALEGRADHLGPFLHDQFGRAAQDPGIEVCRRFGRRYYRIHFAHSFPMWLAPPTGDRPGIAQYSCRD